MHPYQSLFSLIAPILKQNNLAFKLEFRKNWGSKSQMNRKKIRRWIFNHIGEEGTLDLNRTPFHWGKLGSISISHCEDIGAALIVENAVVGLDIESSHRINLKIKQKIERPLELKLNIPADLMWVIKEAVFKAHQGKLDTIFQVHIHKFLKVGTNKWSFETEKTHGICLRWRKWALAIALRSDSL